MKIALALHGLFNSTQDLSSRGDDGYNHIKKHILDKGDVDVFIHSWEVDKKEMIESLYKPVKSTFEPQIDFLPLVKERKLDKLPNPPRKPETILSHLYSVQLYQLQFVTLSLFYQQQSFQHPVRK